MKKVKKKISIFKIIALTIAFILLATFICLYIYLRLSTPQRDGLFIPPSEKKIVRLLEFGVQKTELSDLFSARTAILLNTDLQYK